MKRHAKAPSALSAARAARASRSAGRRTRGIFVTACLCVLGLAAFVGSGASSAGADIVLHTPPGTNPSDRAWELVSPLDKNGGNIASQSTRTRAATDGDAVQLESSSAFGDAVGTGIGIEYIARRDATPGTQGWSTHAITPYQEPLSFNDVASTLEPRYHGEFSPDLSTGVFLAHSPLSAEGPNVAAINNLYLRQNLLSPGGATSTLLTDCPAPACTSPFSGAPLNQPGFAGASADFGHVIFESRFNLTQDAVEAGLDTELPKLYEWDHGTVRLAGVLPDSACGTPPCPAPSSAAGRGAGAGNFDKHYTERTISTDGSRILFTSPVEAESGGISDSDLYLREDHTSTTQINAELPDGQATFWAANADLSRIFFTQGGLYMWSEDAVSETQTLTVAADSGTFTLEFDGALTTPLAFNAPAATVQAALNGLSTIGGVGGSVTVTGGPGDASGSSPYAITFAGTLDNQNVAPVNLDLSNLGAAVGKTLTCTVGGFGGSSDGFKNVQWLRNGTPIPSATAATYTTVGADAGAVVQCQGFAIKANSGATQVANPGIVVTPLPGTAPPTAPADIAVPVVAGGELTVGSDPGGLVTLTCDPGSWTGAPTFGYQWYRNGVALSGNGAGSGEYTVQAADLAAAAVFQCAVTGSNAGGAAVKVSANVETTPGPSQPQAPIATATMSRLATSVETVRGGHLTEISVDSEPDDDGATIYGAIGASEDGDYVYFIAGSQLVDDNVPNTVTHPCGSEEPCIFAWHQGTLRYVARANSSEKNAIIGQGTWTFEEERKAARITPDGTRLVFISEGTSDDPYDHGSGCANSGVGPKPGCKEVYLYDATANGGDGQLTCASCNPGGVHTTPTDADFNFRKGGGELQTSHLNRAISDDGRYVFFSTGEPLVPADTNGAVNDVYQYDSTSGEVSLLSSGKSKYDAYFMDASADGADVFFTTKEQLTGWDVDNLTDLYDARAGGGIADPPPPPPSCEGDGCQPAPQELNDSTPSSSSFAGQGNPTPRASARKRCARNQRKVRRNGKARCVKKSRQKSRANNERRASR